MLRSKEKPLHWVASSKKDVLRFPEDVIDGFGYALGVVQQGGTPPSAKPWKGEGPGVLELARCDMAKKSKVQAGSGDVFVDLGFKDADERRLRVKLAMQLNELIAKRGLTQSAAAELFGVPQPHISDLKNYKLSRFSSERLLRFLTFLDKDVEIVIRPKKTKGKSAGHLVVSMA